MRSRRIAVVTALPPSQTTLNEYGFHLVRALGARQDIVEVVALVEELPSGEYADVPGVTVVPCWRFGSLANPWRIARALREVGADAVIFNLQFSSFGDSRVSAAAGLFAPLLARLAGVPTITLLHNIVETVDLAQAGFGFGPIVERLMRAIGTVLTRLLLASHLVAVTMPRYVEILRGKYRARNVVLVPHGAFEQPAEPDFTRPEGPPQILAFGKFGTYKRVEPLIEAFRRLSPDREVELVIAGTDSPNAPGYLADVEARLGGPGIRFTGYVAEEDVPQMFRDAAVAVFPYSGTTGSSGVLHQAASYGCPVVLPRIGDLADVLDEEGFTAELFEVDDPNSLAAAIARVLDSPDLGRRIGIRNYRAACGLPIDQIAGWYVLHAEELENTRREPAFAAAA